MAATFTALKAFETAARLLNFTRTAWRGEKSPDDGACLAWLRTMLPLHSPRDDELLEEGLRLAGIPCDAWQMSSELMLVAGGS